MNPYVASRLVDDRLADDRCGLVGPIGGEGTGRRAGRASLRAHVDPAAWCLKAPVVPLAGAGRHAGGARPGRVRRIAGWLLVDAGLRMAVGRRPAALRG